jgi:uncharacterized protein involved in exopolysaccharide biosynthesis/Mrp family chromosome partitioning ATPase
MEGGWDFLRKVWRRKGLVIGLTLGLVVIGIALAATLTPRYTAETRLLVGVEQARVTNIESLIKGLTANIETVESEAYVVASQEIARRVGYRLALDKSVEFNPTLQEDAWYAMLDPRRLVNVAAIRSWFASDVKADDRNVSEDALPEEDALSEQERIWQMIDARILNRIEVSPLTRSHVLAIKATAEEPVTAARIANSFAEVYIQQQVNRRRQTSSQANDWLEQRIGELQKNVQEAERQVESYRREAGLYETKSDTIIAQQLATLNQSLVEAENAQAQAQARLAQAQGSANNPESLPAVLMSANITMLRTKQVELEREAAELSATYTKEHPRVRNIQGQIAGLRGEMKQEIARIVDGLRQEERVAADRYKRVTARLDELQGKMGVSNNKTIRLRELEREAETARGMLASLMQRSQELINQPTNMSQTDAVVISRAGVPMVPSFPPTMLIVILAAAVGFVASILVALLLENLDQTFRTGEEIEEYTGLPALALLPRVEKKQRRVGHVVRNPYSSFTEGLRMLGARLSLGEGETDLPGLVMFTSALPGEGKSFTSSSFAQLMALEGRRVILLDLDWRKPTLHKLFGQPSSPGLVELLNREVDAERAIYRDPQSGAHVMFTGNVGRVRSLGARIEYLRMLLKTLSRHYDVIILDTPPVMFSPEVLYLARLAEKIVLNVKWASTPRRAVASEIKNLMRAGAATPGVVLSQIDPRRYNKYSYEDAGYMRHKYLTTDVRS